MPVEKLRSRTPGSSSNKNGSSESLSSSRRADKPIGDESPSSSSIDVEKWNTKLSERRRQRRQERLSASKTTTSQRRKQLLKQRQQSRSRNMVYIFIIILLVITWLLGFLFLAHRTHFHLDVTKTAGVGPFQALRQRFRAAVQHKLPAFSQAALNRVRAALPKVKGDPTQVVDMRELNAHLVFDNVNGGAWTQGFQVEPVAIGKDAKPLRIFVVPHSHCDPGWIKTFDEYFQTQTKEILSTVVQALDTHPERKFIWAEISYFEWWWREQTPDVQELTRRLLERRQLEFVTGGWVQPDEANTQLYAMEIQLQEGHDFIRETFGEEYIPKYGWSIDPFGYSPTMAYLLKKYGFEAMLIQRVHYRIKKELAKSKHLEFMWRQTWDTDKGEHDIFTHVMPFYSYDVPHTCGPDPSVCCQFDFARIRGVTSFVGNCPWGKQPQRINDQNVQERAMLLLDQYRKKANLYQSNVVIAPLGDDFRYRNLKEANAQFENYQRIFDYINKNVDGVEISFGTLSEYFQASMGTFKPPILKGAFFTYSDREEDYWSGYFTSRVFDKALDRQLERVLYAATSLGADKIELQAPRRALSLFQHHDGVTGTAKTHVVEDYARQIHEAIRTCQQWVIEKLMQLVKSTEGSDVALSNLQSCWQSDAPRGMSQNLCGESGDIVVYNPLDTDQFCGTVRVAGRTASKASLPCEVPGSLADSKAAITFEPNTGLMTHPIKEEWMVWKVHAGGAYLFFPGDLDHFDEEDHIINQGGYVVKTRDWKRTVVEKSELRNGSTATVIDFVYETFLQNPNEEWLVRFSGHGILNEGIFHTDLNGFNFDTHHFRSDMPIQSQVFPMPTLASIEDSKQRMTIISEHAQGTASLEEGSIDIWLDRRLAQDDERGLAQGVLDNVPTRTRLRVVLETEGYKHDAQEFEITNFCKRMWKQLNHPLEMYGRLDNGGLLSVPELQVKSTQNAVEDNKVSTPSFLSGSFMIPPVYMVYKRADYLKDAIDSLRKSDFPRDRVPIVISHDGHIEAVVKYVESLKSEFHVIQLFHPHACSEHPNTFPGDDPRLNQNYQGDTYGNPRNGKITCCKHHFTWMMNQVFQMDELKDSHGFFFMEEDYVVAPTIYETIQNGLEYIRDKPHYFGLTLDPTEGFSFKTPAHRGWIEKRFVTGPMVMLRHTYDKIKQNAKSYCDFDEYNWYVRFCHLL